MPFLITFLCLMVAIYLCIIAGMYVFQRRLLYHPEVATLPPPSFQLPNTRQITLTTTDGIRITAWHHSGSDSKPTVIYFHGNSGHMGVDYRVERFHTLTSQGFGLLALSYRGYGDSEGSPSEAGLMEDARATIHYALDVLHLLPQHIWLFGESLGSGVAVRMASEFTVGGIILDSPYTSAADRAAELYPWLPIHLIMKDHFNSLDLISRIHAPILIVHGEDDTVIPVQHGKTLLAHANEPKKGVFPAGLAHVAMTPENIIHAMTTFFLR